MAIVKTFVTSKGVQVFFNDEFYRNQTPEEKAAAIDNINRTAYRCLVHEFERRAEEALKKQGETA